MGGFHGRYCEFGGQEVKDAQIKYPKPRDYNAPVVSPWLLVIGSVFLVCLFIFLLILYRHYQKRSNPSSHSASIGSSLYGPRRKSNKREKTPLLKKRKKHKKQIKDHSNEDE